MADKPDVNMFHYYFNCRFHFSQLRVKAIFRTEWLFQKGRIGNARWHTDAGICLHVLPTSAAAQTCVTACTGVRRHKHITMKLQRLYAMDQCASWIKKPAFLRSIQRALQRYSPMRPCLDPAMMGRIYDNAVAFFVLCYILPPRF